MSILQRLASEECTQFDSLLADYETKRKTGETMSLKAEEEIELNNLKSAMKQLGIQIGNEETELSRPVLVQILDRRLVETEAGMEFVACMMKYEASYSRYVDLDGTYKSVSSFPSKPKVLHFMSEVWGILKDLISIVDLIQPILVDRCPTFAGNLKDWVMSKSDLQINRLASITQTSHDIFLYSTDTLSDVSYVIDLELISKVKTNSEWARGNSRLDEIACKLIEKKLVQLMDRNRSIIAMDYDSSTCLVHLETTSSFPFRSESIDFLTNLESFLAKMTSREDLALTLSINAVDHYLDTIIDIQGIDIQEYVSTNKPHFTRLISHRNTLLSRLSSIHTPAALSLSSKKKPITFDSIFSEDYGFYSDDIGPASSLPTPSSVKQRVWRLFGKTNLLKSRTWTRRHPTGNYTLPSTPFSLLSSLLLVNLLNCSSRLQ